METMKNENKIIPTDEQKQEMLAKNIKDGFIAYRSHIGSFWWELRDLDVDDIGAFSHALAKDSVKYKRSLRNLLRRHPNWVEELDSVLISGETTQEPLYQNIRRAVSYLMDYLVGKEYRKDHSNDDELYNAVSKLRDLEHFLMTPFAIWASTDKNIEDCYYAGEDWDEEKIGEWINTRFPKAYAKGKKKSKIIRAILTQLGVWEDAKGDFQYHYAGVADELNSRQIKFPFFISVNPAFQFTMSNPSGDNRGECLVSCHSLTSDYEACRAGAVGYARDEYSIICFVPSNIELPETMYNRKIMRQMFMYKDGTLMQSRLYDTQGGRRSDDDEGKNLFALYRHLVEKVLADCEGLPNQWETAVPYEKFVRDTGIQFNIHKDFQGYPDWLHGFPSRVTKIKNHNGFVKFTVGNGGLCCKCGCETTRQRNDKLLCEECGSYSRYDDCYECNEGYPDDELYRVYDRYGDEVYVCEDCRDRYYRHCAECGEYYHEDYNGGEYVESVEGYVCRDCLENEYFRCNCCGEYMPERLAYDTVDGNVCEWCFENRYTECDICHEYHHNASLTETENGDTVCESCLNEHYTQCDDCGGYYPSTDCQEIDGNYYCPDCAENHKEDDDEDTDDTENTETEAEAV